MVTNVLIVALVSFDALCQEDSDTPAAPETTPDTQDVDDGPPPPSPQQANETPPPPEASTPQQQATSNEPITIQDRPMYEGYYWNLNLMGGYAVWHNADIEHRFVGRIRAGVLKIREPWFGALDVSFDYGGLVGLGGGIHVELIHLWSGLWGQVFVALANDIELVTGVSAGWSILGIEFQLAPTRDQIEPLLLLKLRIPIGVLTYGLTHLR